MQNPRLAARYAKSLMDIALEQNKLEVVYTDMQGIESAQRGSAELVSLMRSPIIKSDTKNSIVKALFGGKIDTLTEAFINLIINKKREFFLPEIVTAFIAQYKQHKNINDVKLTTAHPLDADMLQSLQQEIEKQLAGKKIELNTEVDESLIGGFVLEANNNLFDASIVRDLRDIKKQFQQNIYIPNIR